MCCCAARREDVAVCSSLLDFGDVEKKDVSLLVLEEDGLRGVSFFSQGAGGLIGVVGIELASGDWASRGISN